MLGFSFKIAVVIALRVKELIILNEKQKFLKSANYLILPLIFLYTIISYLYDPDSKILIIFCLLLQLHFHVQKITSTLKSKKKQN